MLTIEIPNTDPLKKFPWMYCPLTYARKCKIEMLVQRI
jgi:hypothetical protein